MLYVVVDNGRQGIGCGGNGVHVAGEVQINVLHWHNLRITPAGSATLDAHDRPLGRFADRHHRLAPGRPHRIRKADQHGGLALARGGRAHCGHEHELALLIDALTFRPQSGNVDLGLCAAVGDQSGLWDAGAFRDRGDGLQGVGLSDFDVAGLGIAGCRRVSHIPRINAYPLSPP